MNIIYRSILLIYFITHIPITLMVDLQSLFNSLYPELYPAFLKEFVRDQYLNKYGDYLMTTPPVWLKALLYFEILQIPFYFAAIYALTYRKNWIRIPAVIYGSHVTTAVALLLAEFQFSDKITDKQRLILCSFYLPYLIIPLSLTLYMTFVTKPFNKKEKKIN